MGLGYYVIRDILILLNDQIDHTFHKLNLADNLQKSDHPGKLISRKYS